LPGRKSRDQLEYGDRPVGDPIGPETIVGDADEGGEGVRGNGRGVHRESC
jgi:hypothetical protein